MTPYDHKAIEEYWKNKWDEQKIYRTDTGSEKPTFYGLVEFPYPSGAGLHVGHVRSYTGMDVIVRKKRMEGYEVMFPIGWDAFGLPAENYAIKTGIHPSITTRENIDTFRRQLKSCGFSFDWDREVDTTDPSYYKWTQWIFLKLYEKGLAYKKEMPVNWCPKDKCVLANEEVVDGKCERCGTPAEKRNKEQWMLAITKYAERLDKDLDETAFLDRIKVQQRNWIGMSEGSEIDFSLTTGESFTVYTTRADTLFGCTYCVLAPEHALVKKLLSEGKVENKEEVQKYIDEAVQKIDIDRSAEGKEKTGVKLEGVLAINPGNKQEIPVYIADYVLANYGTGAIMAVPAHDERDGEFAKKYGIPAPQVVAPYVTISGSEAPRSEENIVYFDCATAIVKHWSEDKYYVVEFANGWQAFVGGHREEGETAEENAIREAIEESGYTDIKRTVRLFEHAYGRGYKSRKNREEECHDAFYLVELGSDARKDIEDVETKQGGWKTAKEILALGSFNEAHKIAFEHYLEDKPFTGDGKLVNSGSFDGLMSEDARTKITEAVGGRIVKKSKLRDWVFARQRYWGEPIPLVYDKDGKMHPVHESELPITLPQVEKYEPTDNGESPLYQVPEWVNIKGYIDEDGYFHTDQNGEEFRRETDTMPQWAGSSWYFMRYIDPHNDREIGNPEMLRKWLPVTWYNGGMEHTTLHLLYSRFWYKFLFDIGIVPNSEPYAKRTSQGMILGAGGVKMSKSLGNVINPDEIIQKYGADTLRMYEMFIGPFDQAVAWDDKSVIGVRRFIERVYALKDKMKPGDDMRPITHRTIQKVGKDIDTMSFNTAISTLMICLNDYEKEGASRGDISAFSRLLAPFAPFAAEGLWEALGEGNSVHVAPWPTFDQSLLEDENVTYVLQVNGKVRGEVVVPKTLEKEGILQAVRALEGYKKYVGEAGPVKEIFVPGKLINIVI